MRPYVSTDDPTTVGHCCEAALLLSMTGFGEARLQESAMDHRGRGANRQQPAFQAERQDQRSHAMIEPALEQLVREKVRRGTVQVNLRIERPRRPEDYRLNLTALASYRDQLKALQGLDERAVDISGPAGACRESSRTLAPSAESPPRTGPRSRASSAKRSPSSKPAVPRKARPWPLS